MSKKRSSLTGGTGDYNPQTISTTFTIRPASAGSAIIFVVSDAEPVDESKGYKELYFPGTIEIATGNMTTVVEILGFYYSWFAPYYDLTTTIASRKNFSFGAFIAISDGSKSRAIQLIGGSGAQLDNAAIDGYIDSVFFQNNWTIDDGSGVQTSNGPNYTFKDMKDGSGRGIVVYNNRVTVTVFIIRGRIEQEGGSLPPTPQAGIVNIRMLYRFKRVPIQDILTKRAALEFVS